MVHLKRLPLQPLTKKVLTSLTRPDSYRIIYFGRGVGSKMSGCLSEESEAVFNLRLVSLDFYMEPPVSPVPGLDVESRWHWRQLTRETEILVEQQPLQGVLVCDHAGLVINKLSSAGCPPLRAPYPGRSLAITILSSGRATLLHLHRVSPHL